MMAQVNAGRVRFVGRGEYNNSTQYYVFDLVSYNGNSYYAKADTIGNLPTNTTYWQLVAEKGNVGPTGLTGNGISSIEKTSTSGLIDTYTITYTNGNTTTFDVSNGNGIDRIEKTATVGNKDTYTIYFTNGSTTTYEVENGEVTREELEEEVERLSMIYNAFPSTTGEGEEASINGTAEVPFKEIVLKGNTSQESTTGKNLWGGFPNNVNRSNGSIDYVNNADGTISARGTATANSQSITPTQASDNNHYITLEAGTYVLSGGISSVKTLDIRKIDNIQIGNDSGSGFIFTLEETTSVYVRANISSGTALSGTEVFKPMIEKNNVKTEYEPYTGGNPAPSPSYPYPVNVVTGDNEVKVEGKNKFNPPSDYTGTFRSNVSRTLTIQNGVFNIGGSGGGTSYAITLGSSYTIQNGDYLHIFNDDSAFNIYLVDSSNNNIAEIIVNSNNKIVSLDSYAGQTIVSVLFYVNASQGDKKFNFKPMICDTPTATTYEPYQSQTYPINLGSMELCKIGDYQDVIKRSSGKNLFDGEMILGYYNESGVWQTRNDILSSKNPIYVNPNESYYFKAPSQAYYTQWTSNGTFISRTNLHQGYGTLTLNSDCAYILFNMLSGYGTTYKNDIMINEGSTALPYEPYGKVWYKYGAIGKVVLDGSNSESWGTIWGNSPNVYKTYSIIPSLYRNSSKSEIICISDYYPATYYDGGSQSMWTLRNDNDYPYLICVGDNETRKGNVFIKNVDMATAEDLKTWLSTHNTTIYYVLAKPTITPITDTTLIEQLDNLEKAYSYDTQTNISQTNQDKPFIISYEAILSLRNVLNS